MTHRTATAPTSTQSSRRRKPSRSSARDGERLRSPARDRRGARRLRPVGHRRQHAASVRRSAGGSPQRAGGRRRASARLALTVVAVPVVWRCWRAAGGGLAARLAACSFGLTAAAPTFGSFGRRHAVREDRLVAAEAVDRVPHVAHERRRADRALVGLVDLDDRDVLRLLRRSGRRTRRTTSRSGWCRTAPRYRSCRRPATLAIGKPANAPFAVPADLRVVTP